MRYRFSSSFRESYGRKLSLVVKSCQSESRFHLKFCVISFQIQQPVLKSVFSWVRVFEWTYVFGNYEMKNLTEVKAPTSY